MNGIERIAAERQRQIEVEGWSLERDVELYSEFAELSGAGAAYAIQAWNQIRAGEPLTGLTPFHSWRWSREWWKPSADPIRNLEKAGALIAAEIDRLLVEPRDGD